MIEPMRGDQRSSEPDGRIHVDFMRWLMRVRKIFLDRPWTWRAVLHQENDITSGVEFQLEHGLGREYTSFIVCRPRDAAHIYEYEASTADRSVYLPLMASADCTVDVLVW